MGGLWKLIDDVEAKIGKGVSQVWFDGADEVDLGWKFAYIMHQKGYKVRAEPDILEGGLPSLIVEVK